MIVNRNNKHVWYAKNTQNERKTYAKIARKYIYISALFVKENKSRYANETQIIRKRNAKHTAVTYITI